MFLSAAGSVSNPPEVIRKAILCVSGELKQSEAQEIDLNVFKVPGPEEQMRFKTPQNI